jgi:NADH-quinone oxidoreductase subunit H
MKWRWALGDSGVSAGGSLNLSQVIEYQSHSWLDWLIVKQPLAFFVFIVASFAETNRLPFDMPESEQELVGGFNTEYGSMKFALFFMGEYANLTVSSAILVTLFLGGWTLPVFGLDEPAESWLGGLAHIAIFLAKMICGDCGDDLGAVDVAAVSL